MRPASDAYFAAIRGSHKVVTRAKLVTPGQTGVTPTGVELNVMGGSVTVDGSADIRTTASLMLAESWPDGDGVTYVAPYGSEIYLERGIELGNGTRIWVGFGYLRVDTVEQSDAPMGPLTVSCSDRMANIRDGRLLAPQQFFSAATVGDVVDTLVTDVLPGAVIEWDSGDTATLGRDLIAEDDRFKFLDDLVTSLGKIWFWDYEGKLIIKDVPDPTVSVFDVDAGPNGVLVGFSRSSSRDGVNNAVVATGEAATDSTAPPAYGVAYDTDPASPTYYLGAFGIVPQFYSSPFIKTDTQAVTAATSILAKAKGRPYSVDFTAVPNVALEPFDPVTVVFPPILSKTPALTSEIHVLDQLRFDLGSAAMAATTRVVLEGTA